MAYTIEEFAKLDLSKNDLPCYRCNNPVGPQKPKVEIDGEKRIVCDGCKEDMYWDEFSNILEQYPIGRIK